MKKSGKFSLNKEDIKSIAWTLFFVAASAVVTKLLDILPGINFGENNDLLIIILTTVLKTAQKWMQGR